MGGPSARALLAGLARRCLAPATGVGVGSRRGFVSVARELPPDDHVPEPYTGPSKEEVLAMRKEFLSPGKRVACVSTRARVSCGQSPRL
jgi:adenine/guanine phosphoribosyltransferase-like PRPP-binding protein